MCSFLPVLFPLGHLHPFIPTTFSIHVPKFAFGQVPLTAYLVFLKGFFSKQCQYSHDQLISYGF